ncbi:Zn-dependent protease with chaperone function [Streptomyces sp. CG 926]|uniref:M48 family metalloprotease n=1 Tax=Streptomyces sp. CG 926 TaxID=1882405 RepID=UPI000D6C1D01|nr:M48 family metalloprotease [Streptomyces sp. CG 926]PWK73207.1 Zn-dependent protease with chaperone function [Streptomyces sp. CG 926]
MPDTPAPPDDLEYRTPPGTRVTYRARQRRTDHTVWLGLALHLPAFLFSLSLVVTVALALDAWLGVPVWVPTTLWAASGSLAFHRPAEILLARYVLRLHRPLPSELSVLAPVWREVTARAGVDGSRYELWIEDSGDLNALAAAGHIVAVTRRALQDLPTSQLAAVLAHELGHHTSGHSWSGLLGWWYTVPGRLVWRTLVRTKPRLIRMARGTSMTAWALFVVLVGHLTLITVKATYGLPLLLLALPYLTAAVGRRAELRADAHAARLGFGQPLSLTLHELLVKESAAADSTRRTGLAARLLSCHPDHRTRLHHLQRYL